MLESEKTLVNLARETRGTELIVVDEFSMLAASLLEELENTMRQLRDRDENLLFGGLSVIFTGMLTCINIGINKTCR